MLSDADTHAIQRMRELLNEWETMSVRQGTQSESPTEAFKWGTFAEACEAADKALAHVDHTADTYLDDVHAVATERGQR